MKRVVVTGMSVITALGDDWDEFKSALIKGENAVVTMREWDKADGLNTRLAAPVTHFEKPNHYKRKQIRSMGRVALMSTRATERALEQADLLEHKSLTDGSTGVAYGSSTGSTPPLLAFANMLESGSMSGVTATSYIQMMAHTAPVNVGVFFGLKGRVITTSSACTSGSQGIGYAYEAIKFGRQKIMVAGGAEELCITEAAVFDTLYATSIKNDTPKNTPRPFDKNRDGFVMGEGAGIMVIESEKHAKNRQAEILGEIAGYGSTNDAFHITQPEKEGAVLAMRKAIQDSGLLPTDVDYINAHGTSTPLNDKNETNAIKEVFGKHANSLKISSTKSMTGHLLGASGAIEAVVSVKAIEHNLAPPTINYATADPDCNLDYIPNTAQKFSIDAVMSNTFGFGGHNAVILIKRWES